VQVGQAKEAEAEAEAESRSWAKEQKRARGWLLLLWLSSSSSSSSSCVLGGCEPQLACSNLVSECFLDLMLPRRVGNMPCELNAAMNARSPRRMPAQNLRRTKTPSMRAYPLGLEFAVQCHMCTITTTTTTTTTIPWAQPVAFLRQHERIEEFNGWLPRLGFHFFVYI
jgi:hypothetical protein